MCRPARLAPSLRALSTPLERSAVTMPTIHDVVQDVVQDVVHDVAESCQSVWDSVHDPRCILIPWSGLAGVLKCDSTATRRNAPRHHQPAGWMGLACFHRVT